MNIFKKIYQYLFKPKEAVLDSWDIPTKPLAFKSALEKEENIRQLLIKYVTKNHATNLQQILKNASYALNDNPIFAEMYDITLNLGGNLGMYIFKLKNGELVEVPGVDPFRQ